MSKEITKKVLIETQTEQDDFFDDLIDEIKEFKKQSANLFYNDDFALKIEIKITKLKIDKNDN